MVVNNKKIKIGIMLFNKRYLLPFF